MLNKILIALLLIVVVCVTVVLMQPADFRISRSTLVSAKSSAVFAQVNNFHNWEAWSPWTKMDPNAKNSFEGPESGTGAIFRWAGNEKVGEGSNTIVESTPNEAIIIKLEFKKPFAATNTAEFLFKAQGAQTLVTWSMYGKNNFVGKVFTLFKLCEKMVGGQFEQGLANLKSVVEKSEK